MKTCVTVKVIRTETLQGVHYSAIKAVPGDPSGYFAVMGIAEKDIPKDVPIIVTKRA